MAKDNFDKMMRDRFLTTDTDDVELEEIVETKIEDKVVAEAIKPKRGRGRIAMVDDNDKKLTKSYRLSESTINALEVYAFEKKREKGSSINSISSVIEEALKSYIPKKYFD